MVICLHDLLIKFIWTYCVDANIPVINPNEISRLLWFSYKWRTKLYAERKKEITERQNVIFTIVFSRKKSIMFCICNTLLYSDYITIWQEIQHLLPCWQHGRKEWKMILLALIYGIFNLVLLAIMVLIDRWWFLWKWLHWELFICAMRCFWHISS